ncbi:phosphatidate cytidylyltransferase [Phenylobacterium sp.]|uniref:phosphatidate cytidylyltransferase n=1 Tax=Phenylobacterium sp. TaxID=1871053 RepID=UPI0025CBF994|nr:phosphatidate cytidylyltransferase [Phenylobacterium sp.]MCA6285692.1 phosphatidate cytidylyltransferase [Phenylobacterium sp.]MCA6309959.1 phosphatidate cytidylyltransferase [Phenylobacterium sp.]MCA6322559.1 phosphatidate cytidylyltransferase [Phenylobacterium sp.]MCA6335931.1 phosphatidate cytidylyltransferase [Phenylobacterium sp.]MCA6338676.1 phosphatidate cytidylyltransferase [Phenylobacterium sp.]
MTSLSPARRFDWGDLGVRAASAAILLPAALAAVWIEMGPGQPAWPFLLMVVVAVARLSVEWGDMTAPTASARVATAVCAAVLTAVFFAQRDSMLIAWGVLAVGGALAAVVARGVSERPGNAALGVLYIGVAAVCIIWLRSMPQGRWWILMTFAVAWAADIAAYAVGNLAGGPKLWPRFSPNKTWSGFLGGLAGAVMAAVALAALPVFKLNPWAAALAGLCGGLAGMAGDLWESMLKRRFGVKDASDLIPGHGGLLDRVDGLMFVVVILSAFRLVNHLGWGH